MAVAPGEPHRALGWALAFALAVVAIPALAGAAAWAAVQVVTGDDEAGPVPTSTIPEAPGTTVVVPGVGVVPGGATPGGPGLPSAPLEPPPGWPAALAPPAGATITASVENGGTRVLSWATDAEAGPLADVVKVQMAAAGFPATTDVRSTDGTSVILRGATPDQQLSVSIVPSPLPDQPPRRVNMVLTTS
ncbi:hypothetical protein PO878_11020 [Iamia majanohamensis]|uniref:Uncharacterized protein n=1 Tax=Iamia majanohamensis TaxID=467976 RepID=A0AAE9Y2L8_9ACTN|nr:hypothetical protein [Iamia majanohamensis]WCO65030.1 hypothetical protein PO878_11020 [Iamia majanohamensis]